MPQVYHGLGGGASAKRQAGLWVGEGVGRVLSLHFWILQSLGWTLDSAVLAARLGFCRECRARSFSPGDGHGGQHP